MHPDVGKFFTVSRLGLGYFVGMMGANVVYSAGVDIKRLSQEGAGDGGALNVPTRKSFPPGRGPAQQVIFEFTGQFEPERKISRIFFVTVDNYFFAGGDKLVLQSLAGQFSLALKHADLKITRLTGLVGIALFYELLGQLDLFRYVSRGGCDIFGNEDI